MTWQRKVRMHMLRRVMVLAAAAHGGGGEAAEVPFDAPASRPLFVFLLLVDRLHSVLKSDLPTSGAWRRQLWERLRSDDLWLKARMEDTLRWLREDVLVMEQLDEYVDELGVLPQVLGEAASVQEWARNLLHRAQVTS